MKERPKDFNAEEIQAILDGRKTQFRWVIKPPFEIHPNGFITKPKGSDRFHPYKFPYEIGDIIWARETWQHNPYGGIVYRAGSGIVDCDGRGWKSPILMPRWASRITREITNIRWEPLQKISAPDIWAEGVRNNSLRRIRDAQEQASSGYYGFRQRITFIELWNSLNAKKHPWESNPWVGVCEFRGRTDGPEINMGFIQRNDRDVKVCRERTRNYLRGSGESRRLRGWK